MTKRLQPHHRHPQTGDRIHHIRHHQVHDEMMESEHRNRDERDRLRAYEEHHDGDCPLPHEYDAGHSRDG